MQSLIRRILPVLCLILLTHTAFAQEQQIRVATYNIKFLKTTVTNQDNRLEKLKKVVELLDADVIGLQEINDRAALQLLFPPQDWHIIIDDDSGDDQDVAIVARKPLNVIGLGANLNAEPQNFLFPNSASDSHFPNRRDLLFAEIGLPNGSETFFVMVHHAKARSGGRTNTDPRREGAAKDLIDVLKQRFDDKNFILLGDFNDNPDDRSLNILETGDPNAAAGPEEIDGPFLINLVEPLCVAGHVSWGRSSADIVGDNVNTIDIGSRQRNNNQRGTNQDSIFDILFDQLLIPGWMKNHYVIGSAKVFDHEVAMRGNNFNRASDHLPVFANFVFGSDEPIPNISGVRIVSALPNPIGDDAGHEEVTIGNFTQASINLAGWKLKDKAGNQFALSGTLSVGAKITITLSPNTMPLNNSGDDVILLDQQNQVRHQVSYAAIQAQSGQAVVFP